MAHDALGVRSQVQLAARGRVEVSPTVALVSEGGLLPHANKTQKGSLSGSGFVVIDNARFENMEIKA